ncbi:MAG TPA: hypothetical protein VE981_09280, partial [Planctomycetota bacterium]|nr:hypothetical protein [Planctomycetota bacterium]
MLEEEAEIGILALEKGLISQDSLNECLTALSDVAGSSLIDILRKKSLLKPDQIDSLRKEAIHRIRARGGDVPDPTAEPAPSPPNPATPVPASVVSGERGESASASLPAEVQRATRDVANVLGKFVRVQDLGRGSHSAVMKAWDSEAGKYVALKIIKEGGGSEHIARFLKEAKSTVGLDHPGIATVYEAGKLDTPEGARAFVASELVEGETLDQVRARGLQVQKAAQI